MFLQTVWITILKAISLKGQNLQLGHTHNILTSSCGLHVSGLWDTSSSWATSLRHLFLRFI